VEILLSQLGHYGFRGTNLWFKNHLNGRKPFTSISGVLTLHLKKSLVVYHKGSILGPILFLILINDLPKASKFFTILFFDDATLQQLSSKT